MVLFSCFLAFSITAFLLVILGPLAVRIGLVDTPNQRKMHRGKIPLIGGIAMFAGFIFASVFLPFSLQPYRSLFAAGGLLFFLGVLDDFHELSPRARLIGQLVAGLILCWGGGLVLYNLGDLFGQGDILLPGWIAVPVTLFAIVSLINAWNVMDGLDGLAGMLSLIAAIALVILSSDAANNILLLLCAVLLAFLPFNWRFSQPAKVFMGDSGSMFLGLILVWFAIYLTQTPHAIIKPVTMLWLLALPLCELLTVVLHRIFDRRSPLLASRDHMHYLLLRHFSWTPRRAVSFMASIATLAALIGIWAQKSTWPESTQLYAFLIFFLCYATLHKWLRLGRTA